MKSNWGWQHGSVGKGAHAKPGYLSLMLGFHVVEGEILFKLFS